MAGTRSSIRKFKYTILLIRHDRVTESQQTEEFVASRILLADRLHQRLVVKPEGMLVEGIKREIHWFGSLENDQLIVK